MGFWWRCSEGRGRSSGYVCLGWVHRGKDLPVVALSRQRQISSSRLYALTGLRSPMDRPGHLHITIPKVLEMSAPVACGHSAFSTHYDAPPNRRPELHWLGFLGLFDSPHLQATSLDSSLSLVSLVSHSLQWPCGELSLFI